MQLTLDSTLVEITNIGTGISDIQGTLVVELQKSCGGWLVQQTSDSMIFSQNNESERIHWGYAIWESNDHQRLRFNTYRKVNEELTDEYRGTASLKTLAADYKLPKARTVSLPKGTLFPIAHLQAIIEKALSEENTYSSSVFDGSTEVGAIHLNTYIGPWKVKQNTENGDLFSKERYFPTQMSIFEPKNNGMIPDYEVYQEILESGIARSYKVFYDDFIAKGTLERIELLPNQACSGSWDT